MSCILINGKFIYTIRQVQYSIDKETFCEECDRQNTICTD